jgi:hypothetical protein
MVDYRNKKPSADGWRCVQRLGQNGQICGFVSKTPCISVFIFLWNYPEFWPNHPAGGLLLAAKAACSLQLAG